MASYVIILGFDEAPAADVAASLRLADRLRLVSGDQRSDLWISRSRFDAIESALASSLAAGRVRSAALLPTVPPPERRWILAEWRGRIVVQGSLADQLDPRCWVEPASYQLLDLLTFAPSRESSCAAITTRTSPPRRRDHWVETVTEYRASLETSQPTLITAPVQQITSRMRDWFGDLADERVGGAIAVLTLSGVTASERSMVVLRNPAAFGLHGVSGHTTLAAHSKADRIGVRAWGTSSDDPTVDVGRRGYSRQQSRSLTTELAARRKMTGAGYGILSRLTSTADLEVLVDAGLVFEQLTLNGVQNLVAATGSVTKVYAGRPVTKAVPAWCLNRYLAVPAGQPVRPTPLFLPLGAGADQAAVWHAVERASSGLRVPA